MLVRIIDSCLSQADPDPQTEYADSCTNSAWVIGACLECLSARPSEEWGKTADMLVWARTIVLRWGWSSNALGGLVSVVQASGSTSQTIPFEELYPFLQSPLLSHSRPLRLACLRLLASSLTKVNEGTSDAIERCLQAEEISLDVKGSRERALRINRLPVVVRDGDDRGADIAARWSIAQLKVNLRPLWIPAAHTMSALAERFGDLVWGLLFAEVQAATSDRAASSVPNWLQEAEASDDNIWEEERTWRDPSAHKVRSAMQKWYRGDATKRAVVMDQDTGDRFDAASYELQLLSALGECSSLAEKHSRDLVPHFLALSSPSSTSPSRLPRHKLSAWLTLFSKFVNPKALRSTDTLHALYTSLLSHPDRSLQRLALSCILTYKSPHLVPREGNLRELLDDTRWRDALTQLEISEIAESDRAEVVPVVIRLLFGLMLERRGRARGADRRAAVLSAFGGCQDEELYLLVELMLQPIMPDGTRKTDPFVIQSIPPEVSEKQQIGFLTLLGDVVKQLGSRLVTRWPVLLQALLDVLGSAQRCMSARRGEDAQDEDQDGDAESDDEEGNAAEGTSRNTKTIRSLGLKRFADFFRCPASFDFTPYMPEVFRAIISPRLPRLDQENTQAPSALLELFYIWTLRDDHVRLLIEHDQLTLPKVYDCLVASNVKPSVISKVLDIAEHVVSLSAEDEPLREQLLKPHVSVLLTNLSILVERTRGITSVADNLGRRQIAILSQIAPYLTDATQASTLLALFFPLLRKPSKLIPEKVKADLATIMCYLFPLVPELSDEHSDTFCKTFASISQLFQALRSRPAQMALLAAFKALAAVHPSLSGLAELMESLNAFSTKRIDEPDFDRRLAAFASLNEVMYKTLSSQHWLPVLYNMLSFVQDPEELTIRNNAAMAMKRFVEVLADKIAVYEATWSKVLYPGLRNGLRSRNELVRAEILGVLAYAVLKCDNIASLHEMRPLLANGDEEANFFNNIHHVQLHRRTRAMRRLGEYCDEGCLRSTTLSELFVPLISNYMQSSATIDHTLVNEAITVTGRMARKLNWGAYYGVAQQYLKLSKLKNASERIYIRALVVVLDNFHFEMTDRVEEQIGGDEIDEDEGHGPDDEEQAPLEPLVHVVSTQTSRIADAVSNRLLPKLLQHLEGRDETEDSLRIPVAIGIAQIAKHLPESAREMQIGRLFTVLSQILRSKSQETRDLTRETLCRIAVNLGPSYLPLILRELRAALARGPQLHVLAFVTHALLVHVTSGDHATHFATLDNGVNDIAHVSAEVIFGESGKDVQSEDFKTKMREVRSSASKALDTFTITAKFISPSKISALLLPVRNIMKQTESLKVLQQVDDLLRRVAGGLNANQHLHPTDLLVLCHTLISQNARFLKSVPPSRKKAGKHSEAIVQTKRKIDELVDHYANNSFRFVAFGLELFITAHRRSRFDFEDRAIIARLDSMVPVIGNTLYSDRMEVILPALKATAAIVKCPVASIEKTLPVFIRQMIDIIRQAGNTEADAVQTALKSLSTVLRNQSAAQVKEQDLVYLLELISPDIEDPSRQAAVFAMFRAIVARKFVVPEIYDVMDKVSEVMVTSQSPQVQELCRGVLLQFLLDYPQGKGRLRNQMTLLARNLSYVHESGRKSVMELLSAIVAKFEAGLLREYADMMFVALVMVIANDDSAKCREMASELIKSLFSRLADVQRNVIMSHLHSWASQHERVQLSRVSYQVSGIIIDLLQNNVSPYLPAILDDLNNALQNSRRSLDSTSLESAESVGEGFDWQAPYHALLVAAKILKVSPRSSETVAWGPVTEHLLFPHAWVRSAACRLLGQLFAATPVGAPQEQLPDDSPFSRKGMEDVAKRLCLQLRSPNLDESLSVQIVKNLFYIGKCFYASDTPILSNRPSGDDVVREAIAEADDEEAQSEDTGRNQLPWMFSKLSHQARHAHITRRNKASSPANWIHQPSSIFKWFAAMVSHMESNHVEHFLMHILSPLYRIVEDDTIRDPHMGELKTLATELQDLVQAKVGTTKFANVYSEIRQHIVGVQRERRNARVTQASAHPEAAAKKKIHRNALKKESRKRKAQTYADSQGRSKRLRED
ncbi:armadillo-type protein [Fomitopsis serialis]|uniref:armadillo-type protein n=1 Tax=Fomitopsis serialis TaxID=139415 RepID=UPI002008C093|nr:armadillo-type protein [Neoantrodia serialis]KAH9924569.1 armadillo-type protein [Neoantrodia serialis]